MVFDKIRTKFVDFKENRQFDKQAQQDLNMADESLRKQAKEEAKQDFLNKRQQLLEERKQALLEKEKEKYNPKLEKIKDIRTTGEKFKEGVYKLGEKAQTVGSRIGTDSVEYGKNINPINEGPSRPSRRSKFDSSGELSGASMNQYLGRKTFGEPERFGTSAQNLFFGSNPNFSDGKQSMINKKVDINKKLFGNSSLGKSKNNMLSGSSFSQDKLRKFLK